MVSKPTRNLLANNRLLLVLWLVEHFGARPFLCPWMDGVPQGARDGGVAMPCMYIQGSETGLSLNPVWLNEHLLCKLSLTCGKKTAESISNKQIPQYQESK